MTNNNVVVFKEPERGASPLSLSPAQNAAVTTVLNWWLDPNRAPVFHLFGYAGSGKTTLAKYIVEAIKNERETQVRYACFTGKASLVLDSKGCSPASTIHRLIYKPVIEDGKVVDFTLNNDSDLFNTDLLIIDEVSMVGERIGQDLLSFDIPILVLGDPGQLPPIEGAGFFNPDKPEVMLTEIHRQAEDNPIIRLATLARQGKPLPLGSHGSSLVCTRAQLDQTPLDFDQTLCGLNKTRQGMNYRVRELMNLTSKVPQADEKLICLKNNYDTNYINGQMCRVRSVTELSSHLKFGLNDFDTDEVLAETYTPRGLFTGEEIAKQDWKYGDNKIDQFTYGYVITCHKSQGSQWDRVLVFDQSDVFKETSQNWLYTAITRAAQSVTIVQ